MPEEIKERRKRRVAVEKKIINLKPDDSRVTVIGVVLSLDRQSLLMTIEDPSGELTIIVPTEDLVKNIKIGSFVRVIGIVLPYEEGIELRAEIIQDFSELNKELYPILHDLMG